MDYGLPTTDYEAFCLASYGSVNISVFIFKSRNLT